ncbi:hypothetical protein BDQ12DRAFT_725720 [Crucibulum laeve]|uniref:Uncharacterized protein n=1 Tax=Crucibulum laeve TaxID=68775 RepID=A0A5C3LUK0_9AGAR|nr:hypothetical protein BDQ12DRAFT_725720 [Crucibulum laeve]
MSEGGDEGNEDGGESSKDRVRAARKCAPMSQLVGAGIEVAIGVLAVLASKTKAGAGVCGACLAGVGAGVEVTARALAALASKAVCARSGNGDIGRAAWMGSCALAGVSAGVEVAMGTLATLKSRVEAGNGIEGAYLAGVGVGVEVATRALAALASQVKAVPHPLFTLAYAPLPTFALRALPCEDCIQSHPPSSNSLSALIYMPKPTRFSRTIIQQQSPAIRIPTAST